MAMVQPRHLSWQQKMHEALQDGRRTYHRLHIVGKEGTLTPLQQFALELVNSKDFRMFLNETRRAMLGSDNQRRNRGNLLVRKVRKLLLRENVDIPDTLTADLARSCRSYTDKRGFNWLLRRALNGYTFEVLVNKEITFDMEPPRVLSGPEYNDLLHFFRENRNGSKAEVMVLLSLGFTPSNMCTMVRFLFPRNLLEINMGFLQLHMTRETVIGIRYQLNLLQEAVDSNRNRNQQGPVRRHRDGNSDGHRANGHAQRRRRHR